MTGRISKNLRSGFLHEELGILLVRQLAVVAPVPRPDDVKNVDALIELSRNLTVDPCSVELRGVLEEAGAAAREALAGGEQ